MSFNKHKNNVLERIISRTREVYVEAVVVVIVVVDK